VYDVILFINFYMSFKLLAFPSEISLLPDVVQ